ncbi:MAG: Crp/Fnr family transcriptional regulator [Actinobacteria bacterium]|nr:Crp/Fnr family transcriptional regulator [Actinomycetota bacterium]
MSEAFRADVRAALRSCRLWHGASDSAVESLLQSATVNDLPRGSTLVREGDPAKRFGVLVSGKARVYHLSIDGRRTDLETISSGQPIAALAALAGGRYPAHIETTTPASVAWLPREALFDLLESEPQAARTMVTHLATRLVQVTSLMQSLSLDVPSRLASHLFHEALSTGKPSARGLEISLGMRKGDLASALGTVPETLSRAFSRLKEEGIIAVDGRLITILDVRALAERGSGLRG